MLLAIDWALERLLIILAWLVILTTPSEVIFILDVDVLVQLCMGVPWGAPDDLNTFMAMVNNVPSDWIHSAFSIGRHQMAYVAAAVLSGGNVRVGLEDNLWLEKGHLATNAELVARAVTIVEAMGVQVMTPEEVRAELQLTKRALP